MSKFPSSEFAPGALESVKTGLVSTVIKDSNAKVLKAEAGVVMFPVDSLNTFPDMQPRLTGKAWQARVDDMAADMKAHGYDVVQPVIAFVLAEPVEGSKDKVDVAYLENGHTRLAAAKAAGITEIPVMFRPAGWTPQDATRHQIKDNSGEPLSPYEQAMVVSRMKGFGDTEEQIAATLGKTKRYVQDLLVLSRAPAALRNSVLKGEIAAREAVKMIRAEGGEKAAEKVEKAVEKAKASGKKKATPKTIEGGKKPAEKANKAAPVAEEPDPKKAPAGAPDEVAFLRGGLTYATEFGKAAEGIAWIKRFLSGDAKAVTELEVFMGQPKGSYFDASLRVSTASAEEEDLTDL